MHVLVLQQFPHKSQGSPLVSALLNQDVENCALTINGSPQVHLLAANIYENFVQMPDVERGATAFAYPTGIGWSEFQNPQPNRFVTDINTALREEIFDVTEAQGEAEVEPYGLPNNVGVKAVAPV
tara:strand:+ start:572 stop:946 length:375 start_codon:yes stop_codon:yes gene_type:complete